MALRLNQWVLSATVCVPAEVKTTSSGKQVAKVRVVHSVRKMDASGQWVDAQPPIYLDGEVWGTGRDNDWTFERVCNADKGDQVLLVGEYGEDTWEDKNGGGKRTKAKFKIRDFQIVKAKGGGGGGGDGFPPADDGSDQSPDPDIQF